MKNKTPTALITAFSLLLPLGALAQSSTGSSGSSSQSPSAGSSSQSSPSTRTGSPQYPSGSSSTSGTAGTSKQYPSTAGGSTGSSSQYPASGSTAQQSGTSQSYPSTSSSTAGQMAGSHSQQFKLVQEDSLKDKHTAEKMRGKKIVDRDGQTIGKIKHIGLGSVVQDGSSSSCQPYASTSGTGSVGAGAPTGRTSGTGSTGSSSSGLGSTGSSSMSSMSGSSNQGDQVMLYVELDDAVGIDGDRLAAIPASQVRFDRSKEELKLQVGRSELASQLRQSSGSSSNR